MRFRIKADRKFGASGFRVGRFLAPAATPTDPVAAKGPALGYREAETTIRDRDLATPVFPDV